MTSIQDRELVELEQLISLVGDLRLQNCPLRPNPRQEAFLRLPNKEVFFGGAAGGGKSVAMMMAALQYSDVPGYRALLLRPSQSEFSLGGGLAELGHDWLSGIAHWNGDTSTWTFKGPGRTGSGGATLTFGYLGGDHDLGRYAGTSYSFIGFDELTRFKEHHYRRMFRALRQPSGDGPFPAAPDGTTILQVPPRVRSTSNPGSPGHAWVRERFVDPVTRRAGVVFLPSRMQDNPHLNQDDYIDSLGELPTAELHRLLHGNWDIPDDGDLFQRDWFPIIEPHQIPTEKFHSVRAWDLAATEPSARNRDPDWTVGILMLMHRPSKTFYVADIIRERKAPGAIQKLIHDTAKRDGASVLIAIEQEPGASGKFAVAQLKKVLAGYRVNSYPPDASKEQRAWPLAVAAETGRISLVRQRHTEATLDELVSFPYGSHDDAVDALSLAHTHLTKNDHAPARAYVAQGRIDLDPGRLALQRLYHHGVGHHHGVGDPYQQLSSATGIPIYNPGSWQI